MATPTLTALSGSDIAAAIKSLLVVALSSSKTLLFARRLQAIEDGETVNSFVDANSKVNALMFWRESILPPPAAFSPLSGRNPVPFDPRDINSVKGLRREVWTYRFKFYYEFHDGTESANSTKEFDAIVDAINACFWAAPKLGLNSYRIDRHSNMLWPEMLELAAGDKFIHVGNGLLSVLVTAGAVSQAD